MIARSTERYRVGIAQFLPDLLDPNQALRLASPQINCSDRGSNSLPHRRYRFRTAGLCALAADQRQSLSVVGTLGSGVPAEYELVGPLLVVWAETRRSAN